MVIAMTVVVEVDFKKNIVGNGSNNSNRNIGDRYSVIFKILLVIAMVLLSSFKVVGDSSNSIKQQ